MSVITKGSTTYPLYDFLKLRKDQLPSPGTSLRIDYVPKDKTMGLVTVKYVTFFGIVNDVHQKSNEWTNRDGTLSYATISRTYGILGLDQAQQASRCGATAKENINTPTCVVNADKLSALYSNI